MQNTRMPVMFVGHGSPMNAIENNEFSHAWTRMGANLMTPRAILCISAHWETTGTEVCRGLKRSTIFTAFRLNYSPCNTQLPVRQRWQKRSVLLLNLLQLSRIRNGDWIMVPGQFWRVCSQKRIFPSYNSAWIEPSPPNTITTWDGN